MAAPTGFIDIEMRGDAHQVDAMLAYLSSALGGPMLMAYMATVGEYVQERARSRFSSEGDDVSGPWHPLTQVTQNIRASYGFPAASPINKRTGELEAYITQSTYSVTPFALGATVTYPGGRPSGKRSLREKMKTAQEGRSHPATLARPVLGLNERDLLYVLTSLAFMIQAGGRRP